MGQSINDAKESLENVLEDSVKGFIRSRRFHWYNLAKKSCLSIIDKKIDDLQAQLDEVNDPESKEHFLFMKLEVIKEEMNDELEKGKDEIRNTPLIYSTRK